MFARPFIDSLDFAHNGRELRGEVAVAEMPRLQDLLAAPQGTLSYVVRGLLGWDGKPVLELALEGSCLLRCQRCLEGYAYPVNLVSRLLLVPPDELDELADEEDGMDGIAASNHLDVLDMLEEELLLSLPLAPRHPLGECRAAAGNFSRPEAGPFAALAGLKKE